MKNIRLKLNQSFLIFWLLCATGCGYQFSGMQEPPYDLHYISVAMFENKTSEMGVGNILANDLISEVTRDGRMRLTKMDRANGIFYGIVKFMDIETISREKGYAAAERQVKISVDVDLKDRNENLLWAGKGIWATETYLVTEDKLATEYNRNQAIREVSRKIVQNVYQQLNNSF